MCKQNTIRVRIIGCTDSFEWYAYNIGEEFDVSIDSRYPNHYIMICGDHCEFYKPIFKADAEVVDENKHIEYAELNEELTFTRTKLGQAVFMKNENIKDSFADAHNSIRPENWTPNQLRAMADFMETNPNCTLYHDGSGKPIKLN